jgi:hypothetical protein
MFMLALLAPRAAHAGDACALALRGLEAGADLRWRGPCKDGFAHGEGVIEKRGDERRPWRYEGMVEQGRPHGKGRLASYPGNTYNGQFRDGLQEGQGISINLLGDRYEGQWKAGKRDGPGSIVYTLGGRYDGEWKDDRITSRGAAVLSNGRRVEGDAVPRAAPPVPALVSSTQLQVPSLKAEQPRTGSHFLHRIVAGGSQPYGASWEQLSEQQRRSVRGRYALLDENDEPPYPLGGIGGALRAVHAMADAQGAALPGLLSMVVMVDSNGKGQSVSTFATPDPELAALATRVVMQEQFKPARCAGQPCAMGFPYVMEFTYLK